MTSTAQRRRQKRAAQARQAETGTDTAGDMAAGVTEQKMGVQGPTPERRARGEWVKPPMGEPGPMIDLAADMIGALLSAGRITRQQEEAARLFQDLRLGYVAELGVAGYGSCFNVVGGHDSGDGSVEAIEAWRRMENRIGRVKSALLQHETAKGAECEPNDLGALRCALDCVNG